MPRKISRKGLVRKLDKFFSLYIRQRDAGHFCSRRHYSTRWNTLNVFEQCKKCNGFGGGENYIMGKYIDKTYGVGTADEMITLSRQIQKFSNTDLEEMIEEYKNKVKYL